jgi:hypothetical protein
MGMGILFFIHFMILEHLVGITTVGRGYALRQKIPQKYVPKISRKCRT